MELNRRKEQFSAAYVRAVAATAGYGVHRPDPDDDSVDLTIAARGGHGTIRSPRLDIQLKCTANAEFNAEQTSFTFPLPIKNYDDLRGDDVMVPRLLVVVRVPNELSQWTEVTEDRLLLRHCGYWVSLRGAASTTNTTSQTILIPREQMFTVDGLKNLMTRIGQGDAP
ncbi:MAG: DUF4365 domain-containing protein [Magnetococcus sp. DMHC-8]